jgi:hypothetical protein
MDQIIGGLMLLILFVGFFWGLAAAEGLRVALAVLAGTLLIIGWILVAVELLDR